MAHQIIEFEGVAGNLLKGRLELPTGIPPRAYAVFAHCFTCGKDLKGAVTIARALTQKGIAVLRFDFTGLGESEGEFSSNTFSSDVQNLVQAAKYLEINHQAPSLLIGHSLGGAAALVAAGEISSIEGVATIGSPAHPKHVTHLFDKQEGEVSIAGRRFTLSKGFVADLEAVPMKERVGSLKCALLILHAPKDGVVGIENARELYEMAKHPKSFVSLDKADHLLTKSRDASYAADLIAAWAGQYLPEEKVEATSKVTVQTGSDGFLSMVQVGSHRLLADEPKSYGGQDLGPSPYDLIAAGLGACTGMTLRLYSARKQWPLEGVTVEVDHAKIHADDCDGCKDPDMKIDRFTRTIELRGELDEQQRARLMEIANKCPVHKTLESSSGVITVKAD